MLQTWIILTVLVAVVTGMLALVIQKRGMFSAMIALGALIDAGLYVLFFGFKSIF